MTAGSGAPPLVIKVGGSLAETGRLEAALATIKAARVPVVVVPGGGPFADSIRALQKTMNFSDAVGHRLAMLGMHQMAEFMMSVQEGLVIVERPADIFDALGRGATPVWVPLRMIADDAFVPAIWSATSDTLAARLAELLGAKLILLKSVDVEPAASADELARRGVVDMEFPKIVARSGLSWRIFGPRDGRDFAAAIEAKGNG
jgi:aspartokinase-like uncharacterized kinase